AVLGIERRGKIFLVALDGPVLEVLRRRRHVVREPILKLEEEAAAARGVARLARGRRALRLEIAGRAPYGRDGHGEHRRLRRRLRGAAQDREGGHACGEAHEQRLSLHGAFLMRAVGSGVVAVASTTRWRGE